MPNLPYTMFKIVCVNESSVARKPSSKKFQARILVSIWVRELPPVNVSLSYNTRNSTFVKYRIKHIAIISKMQGYSYLKPYATRDINIEQVNLTVCGNMCACR